MKMIATRSSVDGKVQSLVVWIKHIHLDPNIIKNIESFLRVSWVTPDRKRILPFVVHIALSLGTYINHLSTPAFNQDPNLRLILSRSFLPSKCRAHVFEQTPVAVS